MPRAKYNKTDFERDISDGKIPVPYMLKDEIKERPHLKSVGTYIRQKHLKIFNNYYLAHLKARASKEGKRK